MKIEKTSSCLTLRTSPWGPWLVGIALALGGVIPSFSVGEHRLQCDRTPPPGRCTLNHTTLLRHQVTPIPLATITGARVERFEATDSDEDDTYQVRIETTEGDIALPSYSSSNWGEHQRQANQIQQFIQNPAQSQLVLAESSWWIGVVLLIVFVGAGIFVIVGIGAWVTIQFDKYGNRFTLTRRRLFQTEHLEYPLRAIAGIRMETSTDSDGDTISRLTIVLNSREVVPLAPYYTSGYEDKHRIGQQITNFLGKDPLPDLPKSTIVFNPQIILPLVIKGKKGRDAAIADCRARLQRNPKDLEAHAQLVMVMAMEGQKKEAKAHLVQAHQQFVAQGDIDSADQISALLNQIQS